MCTRGSIPIAPILGRRVDVHKQRVTRDEFQLRRRLAARALSPSRVGSVRHHQRPILESPGQTRRKRIVVELIVGLSKRIVDDVGGC